MASSACWLFLFSMATLEMAVKTENQMVLTVGYTLSHDSEPSSLIYFDQKTFLSFQECLFKQSTILCVAHFNYSSPGSYNVTKIISEDQDKNVTHNLLNNFLCLHDVCGNADEVKCTRTEKYTCDSNYKRHQSLNVFDQNNSCLSRSVYISWKGYPKFGIYSYDKEKLEIQQCNCTSETTSSDIGLACVLSTTVTCKPTTFTSEDIPSTTVSSTGEESGNTEISAAEILTSTTDHFLGKEDESKQYILIGAITGAAVLVALITIIGIFILRKRKYKAVSANNNNSNPPCHSSEHIPNLEDRREHSEETIQTVPTVESKAYYSSIDLDFDNNRRDINKTSKANHGNEMSNACSNRPTTDTHVPVDTCLVGEYGGIYNKGINRETMAEVGMTMPGDCLNTEKVTHEEIHYFIIDPEAGGNGNQADSKPTSEKDFSNICVGTAIRSFEGTYNEIKDDEKKDRSTSAGQKTYQDTRKNYESTIIFPKAATGGGRVNACEDSENFRIDFEKTYSKNTYSKLGEKAKDIKNVYDVLKDSKQGLATKASLSKPPT